MVKKDKKSVSILIDELTNSIVNTISGDSFPTELSPLTREEVKTITKSNGWNFNWKKEIENKDNLVFKLTIEGNSNIIQGIVSISLLKDHVFLNLIENAPFNVGKDKLYDGVGGNLFAFACKLSWDYGNQGFVAFVAKTELIKHYEKALGARRVGSSSQMIINPEEALKLILKYFPQKR
ncbi:MAG: hypothetical protein ACK5UE_07285 [Chitinophagales bacterium]|jgi:hypothetical protein|nr:hypothetical protein [Sphingobacteriales bacterium]